MRRLVLREFIRPRRPSNIVARASRNLGLAAWFGGTAAELVGLDCADEVWRRWTPIAAAAITAHVVGSVALGWAGRHRAWMQRGMPTAMALDTLATTVGIGAWGVAERLRRQPATAESRRWARRARLTALAGAGGSLVAQAYLAERQRPLATVRQFRLRRG